MQRSAATVNRPVLDHEQNNPDDRGRGVDVEGERHNINNFVMDVYFLKGFTRAHRSQNAQRHPI